MSVFKSTFDAIGTAAGVAWPSFGILSSALSLSTGGVAMAGLGSVCCALFLLVSIRVFYLSYKRTQLEELRLNNKLNVNLTEFMQGLYNYYLSEKKDEPITFFDYLDNFELEKNGKKNLQVQLLKLIRNVAPDFISNFEPIFSEAQKQRMESLIKQFIHSSNFEDSIDTLNNNELLDRAFLNFVGVFGSVAGCSAGVLGVCAGLGFITSLATIPFVGAIILSTAVVFAACVSVMLIDTNIDKNKKSQVYRNFKEFNRKMMLELLLKQQEDRTSTVESTTSCELEDWRKETGSSMVSNLIKIKPSFVKCKADAIAPKKKLSSFYSTEFPLPEFKQNSI